MVCKALFYVNDKIVLKALLRGKQKAFCLLTEDLLSLTFAFKTAASLFSFEDHKCHLHHKEDTQAENV